MYLYLIDSISSLKIIQSLFLCWRLKDTSKAPAFYVHLSKSEVWKFEESDKGLYLLKDKIVRSNVSNSIVNEYSFLAIDDNNPNLK